MNTNPPMSTMPRWSEYDTDEERLPEGMQRIGYDADEQTYTFRDVDGGIWESAPGNRYGQLRRVTTTQPSAYDEDDESSPTQPLTYDGTGNAGPRASWRQEMMPLLNWFLLVGVFLLVIIWTVTRGSKGDTEARSCGDGTAPLTIKAGDTCWAISEAKSISLDALLENNPGLDCDKLAVGDIVCVPTA
ncbi:carbohydrate-binding module family 50 protein [Xylaria intraflava]|nr:carbohydrate-binding module family 50 protein [Xylaria intraflava]